MWSLDRDETVPMVQIPWFRSLSDFWARPSPDIYMGLEGGFSV